MRLGVLVRTLTITFCVALGMVPVYCHTWTFVFGVTLDDTWTVIEYPEGQEVVVELKPASSTLEAKGTARVLRSGNDTTVSLDVSGVTGDQGTHKVYLVDSLGNASLLGVMTVSDGAGTLSAKTALSRFMIVISSDADLTAIGAETKLTLSSTVPSGFTVVARENIGEAASMDISLANNQQANDQLATDQMQTAYFETPEYEVPLLDITSLRRGANRAMKANFANGFEGTRASVIVKPQKSGSTQIKMRFTNLREAPEGTRYLLWQVGSDNSYTLLGHLTPTANKRVAMINAESALSDFGLFITFENADAHFPAGSLVARIAK